MTKYRVELLDRKTRRQLDQIQEPDFGRIAQAILNVANEYDATLIVLGLTGKNVFARLLAGNVPVELIKSTKLPVLLLPPDWARRI